jgi:3-oxoacyl-[acyl-carrier protein] reductase
MEIEDMQGKVIFITGSAQGLGEAYAAHLASLKAYIVVADINEGGAQRVAQDITQRGGSAMALAMDVTDEASVARAIASASDKFGPIDVLINNAGGLFGWVPAEEVTLADWNKTVALCLTSAWLCSRAVIPSMKATKAGRIINVVSATIDRGLPTHMMPYMAAKGGVAALTRGLARELGPHSITVNAISPGLFVMDKGKEVLALAEGVKKDQSIPRLGVPDDIIGAVAFLASDASSFITGQVLNVDGGWSLR